MLRMEGTPGVDLLDWTGSGQRPARKGTKPRRTRGGKELRKDHLRKVSCVHVFEGDPGSRPVRCLEYQQLASDQAKLRGGWQRGGEVEVSLQRRSITLNVLR